MPHPNRTAKLSVRVRRRERKLIEAAARRRGVYLSELIRDAAVREARRELQDLSHEIDSES